MSVIVEGERIFEAPPARVYAALTRPEVISAAVPVLRGCRVVDETHWEAKVKPPVPFAPSVTIRFEVVDRREPEHASLRAHGGGAHIVSDFDLAPDGDGDAATRTRMRWRTTIELGGILSAFGGSGLEPLARRQAEKTLDRIAAAL